MKFNSKCVFFGLVIIWALLGCATGPKLSRLSVGMTKAEVISILGSPNSTSADADSEVLTYGQDTFWDWAGLRDGTVYLTVFKNGKLVQYGRASEIRSMGPAK